MTEKRVRIYEVEGAINRSPRKSKSGRYAVYIPGIAVVGTYAKKTEAQRVAATWTKSIPDVVVVDRKDLPVGVHTLNRARP